MRTAHHQKPLVVSWRSITCELPLLLLLLLLLLYRLLLLLLLLLLGPAACNAGCAPSSAGAGAPFHSTALALQLPQTSVAGVVQRRTLQP